MNRMYAIVLFLVFITSISSTLCDDSNQEIFQVVDDQTTMHDAGIGISEANRVQGGKFHLEDGQVLTLSRKSSPGRNCVPPNDPCGLGNNCCEGLQCVEGWPIYGHCAPIAGCGALGAQCAFFDECCYPYKCSGYQRHNTCVE